MTNNTLVEKTTHIGRRIHVIGSSCSGKSTLAAQLASRFELPLVELDALNWQANWVGLNETDPKKLDEKIKEATSGESWIVAGAYESFSTRLFWSKLETVIWLDLPLGQLIFRMFRRSWRRWRSKELLWGNNYEKFWPQFMVWKKSDSLLWWIVSQYQKKREDMIAYQKDPQWSHIQFIHLRSSSEVKRFLDSVN